MRRARRVRLAALAALSFVLSACGIGNVCEEPQRYESSELGTRIETPEGLDPLQTSKEQTIPDASPRPPREEGSPCLELPPVYRDEEN